MRRGLFCKWTVNPLSLYCSNWREDECRQLQNSSSWFNLKGRGLRRAWPGSRTLCCTLPYFIALASLTDFMSWKLNSVWVIFLGPLVYLSWHPLPWIWSIPVHSQESFFFLFWLARGTACTRASRPGKKQCWRPLLYTQEGLPSPPPQPTREYSSKE